MCKFADFMVQKPDKRTEAGEVTVYSDEEVEKLYDLLKNIMETHD